MSSWKETASKSRDTATNSRSVSAAQNDKEQKLLIEKIRAFQKSDTENKKCADCGDAGPTYICMDFGSFVCTTCSGLHREFNHRVKGVSVSHWTNDDVDMVLSHGNSKAKDKFMPYYSGDIPLPDSSNILKLRQWIRCKYIEKRWMTPPSPTPAPKPAATQPSAKSNPRKQGTAGRLNDSSRLSAAKKPDIVKPTSQSEDFDLLGLGFSSQQPQSDLTSTNLFSQSLFDSPTNVVSNNSLFDSPTNVVSNNSLLSSPTNVVSNNSLLSSPTNVVSKTSNPVSQFPSSTPNPFALFAPPPVPATNSFLNSLPSSPIQQAVPVALSFEDSLTHSQHHSSQPVPSTVTPAYPTKAVTNQISCHLATSLLSSQRYQGDPFSNISLDGVCEPLPADDGSPDIQAPIPGSVLLSPSMSGLNQPINDNTGTLDTLIKQVTALKGAIHNTSPIQSANLMQSSSVSSDFSLQNKEYGSHSSGTAPAPFSNLQQPYWDNSPSLHGPSYPVHGQFQNSDISPVSTVDKHSFTAPRVVNHNKTDFQSPSNSPFGTELWGFKQTPLQTDATDPVKSWADFDSIPPFAQSPVTSRSNSKNSANPFHV